MLIDVAVQGNAAYRQPLTVSFTYQVDQESGWETPDTLIANAFIQYLAPTFELVSGDSVWVDTLCVRDSKSHSFVIRPLHRTAVYNCISVTAFVDEALTIGAHECVLIDTR